MRTNLASKNLINVFGKISDLNLGSDKLLNIYKIPNHYQNYKRLTLYFGDWRRIEADCLYLRNRKEFERLLVLSKMANFKIPYNHNSSNTNNEDNNINRDKDSNGDYGRDNDNNEEQLLECSDFVKNCKFIYFGSLTKFVPAKHLKSLIIPLDLYSDFYDLEPNNYTYFEELTDSGNNNTVETNTYSTNYNDLNKTNSTKFNSDSTKYQRGLNNLNNAKTLISLLEGMDSLDKVLLCADNNSTWTKYHKLLKYS